MRLYRVNYNIKILIPITRNETINIKYEPVDNKELSYITTNVIKSNGYITIITGTDRASIIDIDYELKSIIHKYIKQCIIQDIRSNTIETLLET